VQLVLSLASIAGFSVVVIDEEDPLGSSGDHLRGTGFRKQSE
jgi:hypothetical protein